MFYLYREPDSSYSYDNFNGARSYLNALQILSRLKMIIQLNIIQIIGIDVAKKLDCLTPISKNFYKVSYRRQNLIFYYSITEISTEKIMTGPLLTYGFTGNNPRIQSMALRKSQSIIKLDKDYYMNLDTYTKSSIKVMNKKLDYHIGLVNAEMGLLVYYQRLRHYFTQTKLAKRVHVKQSDISYIENGGHSNTTLLVKIFYVLGAKYPLDLPEYFAKSDIFSK